MSYVKNGEIPVDKYGTVIALGDVLVRDVGDKGLDYGDFFICIEGYDDNYMEVRDLIAHNVGMCDLGRKGDVVRLGQKNEEHVKLILREYSRE